MSCTVVVFGTTASCSVSFVVFDAFLGQDEGKGALPVLTMLLEIAEDFGALKRFKPEQTTDPFSTLCMCIPVKLATYSGVELATLSQVDNMVHDRSKRRIINN